jgi:membrane protein YqaA with SNARE-associated domain
VADIPISWIAVRSETKAALPAAIVAAVASVIGGLAVYSWADSDPAAAVAAMHLLPGISPAMVGEAASAYAAQGWRAMIEASFTGMPYKLFAVTAARDGHDVLPLLIATPFVRLPRFVAVALLAGTISHLLERRLATGQRLWLLAGLWVLFYGLYFAVMPG